MSRNFTNSASARRRGFIRVEMGFDGCGNVGRSSVPKEYITMTEQEVLFRDIATIKETINRDWVDLSRLSLSVGERAALRSHIDACVLELKNVTERLDELTS